MAKALLNIVTDDEGNEPGAKDPTVVLDFDALVRVKRTVKIKGVHYPLLDPEIYGIEQQTSLLKTRKLLDELRNNPTPANIKAYEMGQDEFVQVVVPSLRDNPVFLELPYQFKEAIIETFFGLVLALKYLPEQGQKATVQDSQD